MDRSTPRPRPVRARAGRTRNPVHRHHPQVAPIHAERAPIYGKDGAILPVGSSHFGVTWPNYRPISAHQLQRCIDHAQRHGPPPDEWLLIRDTNSLCAGQDYRRAVLDAGLAAELAAELAVTTLIRTHLTAINHPDVNSQLKAHRMLGKLCFYWISTCGGSMPENFRQRLVERRNAATHAGMQIPKADVQDAIAVAREIVEQATPLPVWVWEEHDLIRKLQ